MSNAVPRQFIRQNVILNQETTDKMSIVNQKSVAFWHFVAYICHL
jgi:hypothetical protein